MAPIKTPITALGFPGFAPGDGVTEGTGKIIARSVKSRVRYVEVDAILGDGFSWGPTINDRHQVIALIHKGGPQEPKQLVVDAGEVLALPSA